MFAGIVAVQDAGDKVFLICFQVDGPGYSGCLVFD